LADNPVAEQAEDIAISGSDGGGAGGVTHFGKDENTPVAVVYRGYFPEQYLYFKLR